MAIARNRSGRNQDSGNHKTGKAAHFPGPEEACLGRSPNAEGRTQGMSKLLAAVLVLFAFPGMAAAEDAPARPEPARVVAIPNMLSASERENYQSIFADLRAQNWASAAG